jgi:NAD(P)-dependent dehydrogenase (short-subunit alcohol dehydrogenase family)
MNELPEGFAPDQVAVVTGAAGGIGLAAAMRFAAMGMKVVLADLPGGAVDRAGASVAAKAARGTHVTFVARDVSKEGDLISLRDRTGERGGAVSALMKRHSRSTWPNRRHATEADAKQRFIGRKAARLGVRETFDQMRVRVSQARKALGAAVGDRDQGLDLVGRSHLKSFTWTRRVRSSGIRVQYMRSVCEHHPRVWIRRAYT